MRPTIRNYLLRRPPAKIKKETEMFAIWNAVDGYKTYIVIGVYLAAVFVTKGLGLQIPGFSVGDNWVNDVMIALGFGGFRSALNKL